MNDKDTSRLLLLATGVALAAALAGPGAPARAADGQGDFAVGIEGDQSGGAPPRHEIRILHADGSLARVLSASAWASGVAWSPDGRTLAYHRGADIVTQPATGGAERPVALGSSPLDPGQTGTLTVPFTPTWSPVGDEI